MENSLLHPAGSNSPMQEPYSTPSVAQQAYKAPNDANIATLNAIYPVLLHLADRIDRLVLRAQQQPPQPQQPQQQSSPSPSSATSATQSLNTKALGPTLGLSLRTIRALQVPSGATSATQSPTDGSRSNIGSIPADHKGTISPFPSATSAKQSP